MTDANNAVMVEQKRLPEVEKLTDLVKRTNTDKPKQKDIDELRRELDRLPDLWRAMGGDLHALALNDHLKKTYTNALIRESITKGLTELKKELGYDIAPALERILIDNVALCHAAIHHTQLGYNKVMSEGMSLEVGLYWEKKLNGAQRRYLKACETLARVRRLAQPSMQINIGENQQNIVQPTV